MAKILRRHGWKPQKPDHRDHKVKKVSLFRRLITMPSSIDLRSVDGPIEDQGQIGSCTAHSLAGALQFLEKKLGKEITPVSRLFIYYNERDIEGTVGQDAGAEIRDGIKELNTKGICPEPLWPYVESKFKVKPPISAYKKAVSAEITSYKAIATLTEMKSVLASGYPFVFGISVYESFEGPEAAKTGIIPMPSKSEKCVGGHAVCAVGYSDIDKWIIVRNSWGTNWGSKGYFYLPYAYISNPDLASDFWVIYK